MTNITALAKAFHDGPLGANDHDFNPDNEQGKWCLEVVKFIAEGLSADVEPTAEGEAQAMSDGELIERLAGPIFGTATPLLAAARIQALKTALHSAVIDAPKAVAWRVEHGGGATIWGVEADADKNAKATRGTVTPLYDFQWPE